MSFKAEDTKLRGLFRSLTVLSGTRITAGIHKSKGEVKHPNSELTVAQLLAVHDGGVPPYLPERPVMRTFVLSNEDEISRELGKVIEQAIAANDPKKVTAAEAPLTALLLRHFDDAQWNEYPLALATLQRKAPETRVLVETGTIRDGLAVEIQVE